MKTLLFIILFLASCGSPSPIPADKDFSEKAEEIESRLLSNFLDGGYLIHKRDGESIHKGDSVLFTSIAFGIIPCEKSQVMFDAVMSSIEKNNGALLRFDPLPQEYLGRETSFDQETGFLYGLIRRYQNCPEDRAIIERVWETHREFTKDGEDLYPEAGYSVPKGFRYVFDLISHNLGQRTKPHSDRKLILKVALTAWTSGVVAKKASCYRIHLSQLYYLLAKDMGEELNTSGFCAVTKSTDIPLTDWLCGRNPPGDWLGQYRINEYRYRHQRCGAWETEDNAGVETNGLDFLTMYYLSKEF